MHSNMFSRYYIDNRKCNKNNQNSGQLPGPSAMNIIVWTLCKLSITILEQFLNRDETERT